LNADEDSKAVEETVPKTVAIETPVKAPASVVANSVPTAEALASLPPGIAIDNLILPMRIESGSVVCLVAEPIDQAAIAKVQQDTGKTITALPTPIAAVVKGIRLAYSELAAVQARDALLTPKAISKPNPFAFLHALKARKA